MKVYLEAVGHRSAWHDQLRRLEQFAREDDTGRHSLVSDMEAADIILTVFHDNPLFSRVKCDKRRFIFCSYDTGFPILPGLYPSVTPWNFDPAFARSSPYLPDPWEQDAEELAKKSPEYLFSFVGSALTWPIRERVLRLRHPRAVVRDTSADAGYRRDQPAEIYQDFRQSYQNLLASSRFVLCPRGLGVSSIRLFETMRAGRVPVIIADDWLPPAGPCWPDFTVRIREEDLETIPRQLESLENEAEEMGALARREWEKYFSERTIFNWMVEQLAAMQEAEKNSGRSFRRWKAGRLLDRRNFRSVGLEIIKHQAKRRVRPVMASNLSLWRRKKEEG